MIKLKSLLIEDNIDISYLNKLKNKCVSYLQKEGWKSHEFKANIWQSPDGKRHMIYINRIDGLKIGIDVDKKRVWLNKENSKLENSLAKLLDYSAGFQWRPWKDVAFWNRKL